MSTAASRWSAVEGAAVAEVDVSEREARDALRMLMLDFGADDVAYVMAQSGAGGYDNIVLEPRDDPLRPGDVLIIDTGMGGGGCRDGRFASWLLRNHPGCDAPRHRRSSER